MSLLSGLEHFVKRDEPLAARTWLKVGGSAEYFAQPHSVDDLAVLVSRCREQDTPIRLMGGGSNLLVRDEGVSGVVVALTATAFTEIQTQGREVIAGGGAKLGHVVSVSVREGLAGLETLVGIPGSVGGALHGNSGSRAGDIGQWTVEATVMTRSGEILTRKRSDLAFGYRESSLDELVILGATFHLDEDDPRQLTKRMQKQWIIKKAAQPLSHQTAGCIFKNPRGMSAGMLIEQSGLKGASAGGAEVSDRHANFIVTHPGATSADVLALIDTIHGRVTEHLGVELEREIDVW